MPTGVYKRTEWHKKILSDAHKGKLQSWMIGHVPWNRGIKTGLVSRNCWQKGHTPWNKSKHHSQETINLIKERRATQIMPKRSDASKQRTSEIIKKMWKDVDYAKRILKANQAQPNAFEVRALAFLNETYNNQFIYTGDGSLIVNGRSADAYSETLNTIALFHGVYWHLEKKGLRITKENQRVVEEKDSPPFTKAGYKVLFVWEHELKERRRVMARTDITDPYNKVIARLEDDGRIVLLLDPYNKALGRYDKVLNETTDMFNKLIGHGNLLATLIR